MADNEATEPTKEKRTVPAMVRTARGVANHAAAVLEMQWDKERKAFKDPITVSLALFTYAKLTAALLDEAEARIDARAKALEIRTEKLEQQIAAFESWRAAAEKQGAEMAKQFEEMVGEDDPLGKLKDLMGGKPVLEMKEGANGDTNGETTIVPLKPAEKSRGEKGGAA
jgi:hypothetical protein